MENDDNGMEQLGRITIGLFGTHAPLAVENFRGLISCNTGQSFVVPHRTTQLQPDGTSVDVIEEKTVNACYKDTIFHRIIPYFMVQGGDFTHGDGTGGTTILPLSMLDESQQQKGPLHRRFPLEGWGVNDHPGTVKFNRKRVVAMAHPAGKKDANGSQFFITTVKTQWLDGQYTIFGTVLHGSGVVTAIENEGTFGGRPHRTVVITDCGELPLEDEDREVHY
jgi:cyclophilin family peptidyl-prolyl cis-trans isomerase